MSTYEHTVFSMSIWDHLAPLRYVWQAVTYTRQPLYAGWQMAVVASTVSILWLFRGEFCYNLSDLLFIEDQLAEWSHLCCRVTRRTKKVLLDGFTTSSRCDLYLKFKTPQHVYILYSGLCGLLLWGKKQPLNNNHLFLARQSVASRWDSLLSAYF